MQRMEFYRNLPLTIGHVFTVAFAQFFLQIKSRYFCTVYVGLHEEKDCKIKCYFLTLQCATFPLFSLCKHVLDGCVWPLISYCVFLWDRAGYFRYNTRSQLSNFVIFKMADSVLWLVRSPVNQSLCEGSIALQGKLAIDFLQNHKMATV